MTNLVDKVLNLQGSPVDKSAFLQEPGCRAGAVIALLLLLAGCAAPRVELQRVSVPVPVACQEPVPARPAMPTEGLRPPVSLDAFAAAAMAEIERREGYEGELLTALENCRKPIGRSAGAD